MVTIRPATPHDNQAIWAIFQPIAAAGDTYAYAPDISRAQGLKQWVELPRKTYVATINQQVVATYYLKTNHQGPGSHVCNCGYMVAEEARGQGLATQLCLHSQQQALTLGYKAMQFNFVAASNIGAVKLWQRLGYAIVGTLPKAFAHPQQGYVDALVMYKWLETESPSNP